MNDNKPIVEGLDLDQAALNGLRERHGTLYRGEIRVTTETGEEECIVFLFRRPVHKDSEAMAARARLNPAQANRNLLSGVIVHPSGGGVVARLRDAPVALAAFVESELLPFLGAKNEVSSAAI